VGEPLLDHRLLQDRRDDLQLSAAVRAVHQVDFEHGIEQLGSTHRLSFFEPDLQQAPARGQ
jgi:hypothetical protein